MNHAAFIIEVIYFMNHRNIQSLRCIFIFKKKYRHVLPSMQDGNENKSALKIFVREQTYFDLYNTISWLER